MLTSENLAYFWVLYFYNIPTCNMLADSVSPIQNQKTFGHLPLYQATILSYFGHQLVV